jgi:peptidoglycan/xylan/chitin deacetylase (PgdA/CDA1 family)
LSSIISHTQDLIINFFGINLPNCEIKNKLTENEHNNKFSLKQKIYYICIRPIISIPLRKKLQEKYNLQIKVKENFIDDSFVNNILNYESTELQSDSVEESQNIKLSERIKEKVENFKYKDNNNCAVVLTHDVEEQHGFDSIPSVMKLEEKYGFKSSWNIVPYKYKIDEKIISKIKEAGNEIGIHGYNHDGKLYFSKKIFNQRVPFINEAIKKYGGVGFRSPMVHRNFKWLQKLNIEYDASCFDYDPFQPFPGGAGSIWPFKVGKFVELPYTLPQDHTMFYVLKVKDISIWKNKIDWLVKNKGVVLALTHPDYLIDKNNMKMYEELLEYLNTIQNAWRCLPKDLAIWFKKTF